MNKTILIIIGLIILLASVVFLTRDNPVFFEENDVVENIEGNTADEDINLDETDSQNSDLLFTVIKNSHEISFCDTTYTADAKVYLKGIEVINRIAEIASDESVDEPHPVCEIMSQLTANEITVETEGLSSDVYTIKLNDSSFIVYADTMIIERSYEGGFVPYGLLK